MKDEPGDMEVEPGEMKVQGTDSDYAGTPPFGLGPLRRQPCRHLRPEVRGASDSGARADDCRGAPRGPVRNESVRAGGDPHDPIRPRAPRASWEATLGEAAARQNRRTHEGVRVWE